MPFDTSEYGTSRRGLAGFIFLAMQYVKNDPAVKAELRKRNLHMRLVLESPDFPPNVILFFDGDQIIVKSVTITQCADSSKWDAKMIAPTEIFLNYFTGTMGTLRPMLLGQIKTVGLLKLTKLIWFIKANHRFFGPNRSFAKGVFYQLYSKKAENKVSI